jgi:glycosyltransferase involved in cell wall biosynthesis
LALDKLGYKVSLFATTGTGDYVPKKSSITEEKVKMLWENQIKHPTFAIRNIYPPRIKDMRGRYNLISFAWEESSIPREWIDDLNTLDGISVTTNFVKDVLTKSGVKSRIEVIPNGVEIDLFQKDIPPMKLNTNKKFLFLNVGSGFPRKGIDVLLKAYVKEFSKDDDVCLVLKTFPNPHNHTSEQIKSIVGSDGPEVLHIDTDISQNELVSLYKKCDCCVSPTRGEGFGLTMAEAMLCKIPVIATRYGGHLDFCDEENSYLINFELKPSETHLKKEHSMEDSLWAEPDIDHLRQLMRYICENKDSVEVKKKVDKAYANIVNNFSWDESAKKTIQFLEKIQSKINLGMVSTWNIKCGIAQYTKYLLNNSSNIQEITVFSNKVQDLITSDDINVIRCWDAYFDDLDGLYNEILKRDLDIVHIQFNFGLFELNSLAGLIRKLKSSNIKTIITFHSIEDTVFMNKPVSLDSVTEELKLVDNIWVHTSGDVKKLSQKGISENVVQIPQGNVSFPNNSKEKIRKGIFNNSKIISTFGFLLPHKGVLETIKGLPLLINKYPDILFLVVSSLFPGDISREYMQKCQAEVDKLNLNSHVVFFTDFLEEEEIIELLQASDIVVMPYKETKEASSAAIRFALASHRPVIVTDIPIFYEFKDNVYKISKCSSDIIAEGIITLYSNNELQKKIVESAERKMEECSWRNIAKRYEDLLYEINTK